MAIEAVPLPVPASVDKTKFNPEFGREIRGVKAGELSVEEFLEIHELLHKVRVSLQLSNDDAVVNPHLTDLPCA